MKYIIYEARNLINGKVYIGQTSKTLNTRRQTHIRDAVKGDLVFHRALRKYGQENFTWSVIDSCQTKPEANELEIFYIKSKNSKISGYNMTEGGDGCDWNRGLTKETDLRVKRLSEKMTGRSFSKNHRENISNAKKGKPSWNKGVPCKQSTREKLSDYNRQNPSLSMLGKSHTLKSKKKMHEAKKSIKDDIIIKIKNDLDKGLSCRKIGQIYNISEKTVSRIKRGKRYKLVY